MRIASLKPDEPICDATVAAIIAGAALSLTMLQPPLECRQMRDACWAPRSCWSADLGTVVGGVPLRSTRRAATTGSARHSYIDGSRQWPGGSPGRMATPAPRRLRARPGWQKLCLVRAAVLHEHGGTPRCSEFDEPSGPGEEVIVDVAAAGLHHLDLLKATGTYYTGPPPLPSVVGTDGVGSLADGRRVYFDQTLSPYGSMCERTLVAPEAMLDVAEGVEAVVAAALGNTGLGAWLALTWRAGLSAGETVFVLGATGAVGTIAVQAAKLLGAGRVIAAALPDERLARLKQLGADAVIELGDAMDLTDQIRSAASEGVNVTIDLLWGEYALAAMRAAARFARHIEVGSVAAADLVLPAALLRSASVEVRGFSVAHPPLELRREAYLRLTEHAARGEITVDVEPVSLEDVGDAWERQKRAAGGPKLVIVPSGHTDGPTRREERAPT